MVLEQLVRAEPGVLEAHRLLGGALQALGDLIGAERALRTAVALDSRSAAAQAALGDLLANVGRDAEAELAFRAALAGSTNYPRADLGLTRLLLRTNRPQEALTVIATNAASIHAGAEELYEYANCLSALQRMDEAIAAYRKAAAAAPTAGIVEHNLAAALEATGRHADALLSAQRALSKGCDMAPTWSIIACANMGEGRFDEAEAAFREALKRQPDFVDAHRELAQLIWMRTEDVAAATADLDAVLRRNPDLHALAVVKSTLLANAGDDVGAYAILEGLAQRPDADASVLMAASDAAMKLDVECSVTLAQRAAVLMPQDISVRRMLGIALLSAGRAEEALRLAEDALRIRPLDQHLIAIKATAWRQLADPRYAELYDYENLVRTWTIDTPDGWPNLAAYLADLAASLRRLHLLHTHPIGQSLRHGTQTTQNLMRSNDPAIRAFPSAIDAWIRAHMSALDSTTAEMRQRNTGRYKLHGLWSVQLRSGGYHTNHVHPEGWLSSACYIDLPAAVQQGDREGWLKFGEPGMPTHPPLPPEFFVQPKPGLLALFPSYMWHGTVPFSSSLAQAQTRLSVAFDVVPG